MMNGLSMILWWVAIGFCASIAGWIWPFRRGLVGILLNLAVSVTGAVGGGMLGWAFHAYGRTLVTTSFLWATVGAIVALTLSHVVWSRIVHARSDRSHQH